MSHVHIQDLEEILFIQSTEDFLRRIRFLSLFFIFLRQRKYDVWNGIFLHSF